MANAVKFNATSFKMTGHTRHPRQEAQPETQANKAVEQSSGFSSLLFVLTVHLSVGFFIQQSINTMNPCSKSAVLARYLSFDLAPNSQTKDRC